MGTRPTCVSATTEKCFQRPDGWRRISDLWIWYFSVLIDWVPRQVPPTLPYNQILLPVRLNVFVDVCAPPVPKQRVPATLGSQFLPFPQHPPPPSPCSKAAEISMFPQARGITFIAFFSVSVLEITLKILSIFLFLSPCFRRNPCSQEKLRNRGMVGPGVDGPGLGRWRILTCQLLGAGVLPVVTVQKDETRTCREPYLFCRRFID